MSRRLKNANAPETTWSLFLKPGLGVKRWLLAALAGIMLTSFGLAILLYVLIAKGPLHWFTLSFLPEWLRGAVFVAAGGGLAILGAFRLHAIIVHQVWPELSTPERQQAVRAFLQRQQRRSGPRIVAIGGGTGMPQLLRGLRAYTDNLTAIVTVADDGGSSGRLRRQTGMLPPGDFRNNIAALSEAEGLMTRLFQYRFAETRDGHALVRQAGNEWLSVQFDFDTEAVDPQFHIVGVLDAQLENEALFEHADLDQLQAGHADFRLSLIHI